MFVSPIGDDRFYDTINPASVVPTGLDFSVEPSFPGDESPGYYRKSLRDNNDLFTTNGAEGTAEQKQRSIRQFRMPTLLLPGDLNATSHLCTSAIRPHRY